MEEESRSLLRFRYLKGKENRALFPPTRSCVPRAPPLDLLPRGKIFTEGRGTREAANVVTGHEESEEGEEDRRSQGRRLTKAEDTGNVYTKRKLRITKKRPEGKLPKKRKGNEKEDLFMQKK